jgi:hypothetical protein
VSRKKYVLAPVDEAKVIICELSATEIESIISYSQYWLSQIRKREKLEAKKAEKGTL